MPIAEEHMALARRGAAVLYARGAAHVWLFGSLAWGRAQDRRSDIDLAVDGMSTRDADDAEPAVRRAAGCKVDVVSLDDPDLPLQLRAQAMRSRALLPRDEVAPAGSPPSRWYGFPGPGRRLHLRRYDAAIEALARTGARRVIDLGCGGAWLLEVLARDPRYTALAGADLAEESLAAARQRLARVLTVGERARVQLFVSILTWRDPRLLGWDAATAIELIEHLDEPQRLAFESVLFKFARPPTVLLTTPNADYNVKFRFAEGELFRHPDHRFEWTRAQFEAWGTELAARTGYRVALSGIGPVDPDVGAPTQQALFSRGEGDHG